jgi:uncharacterized cofD-like protein
MPVVNKGLVRAGYRRIQSIVTTFDSGGHTGRMRTDERGQIMAFSDYWRSLMSLWIDNEHKAAWERMLLFRDGRERNFGNVFFQFMAEKTGELHSVQALFEDLTGAQLSGEVIPVALEPSEIGFRTLSGRCYHSEHYLDELRMSLDRVAEIWLEPPVQASERALTALTEADLVVICPGSLYGSILANFLPSGMIEAYRTSAARKVLLANIMTVANETPECTQAEYAGLISRYLQDLSPFDLIVMPDLTVLGESVLRPTLDSYSMEHSLPLRYSPDCPTPTIVEDIVLVEPHYGRLRHCEHKLGELFKRLDL